jgi:hypothetical protein
MGTRINYLSISVKIGGYDLILESDRSRTLAELGAAADETKDALKTRLKEGISFQMEKDKIISINVGEFIRWAGDTLNGIDDTIKQKLEDFFKSTAGAALDGIIIDLWDLSISTALSFSFCVKVTLTDAFYKAILGDSAETIGKIIKLNSIGFGMSYERDTPKDPPKVEPKKEKGKIEDKSKVTS